MSTASVASEHCSRSWDGENRLVGVTSPLGTETYTYNADRYRVLKSNSSGVTTSIWDGENIVEERCATNGNLHAHYAQMPGWWGGLLTQQSAGARHYYAFDPMGNTWYMTDDACTVTDMYIYKAFGEEIWASQGYLNPMRFGGQYGHYRDGYNAKIPSWLYVRAREPGSSGR